VQPNAMAFQPSGDRVAVVSVKTDLCPCLAEYVASGALDSRAHGDGERATRIVRRRSLTFENGEVRDAWIAAMDASMQAQQVTWRGAATQISEALSKVREGTVINGDFGFSIEGLSYQAIRARLGPGKNVARLVRDALLDAGRSFEIPEAERRKAAELVIKLNAVPLGQETKTLGEWKGAIGEAKVDNRDLKLALDLACLPWTTSNARSQRDATLPVQTPEGAWYCIVRKAELTEEAQASYARAMTCVHTPRRATAIEAVADRAALLMCVDVAACLQRLNHGRTAFDGSLGPNLRLEDGRFAVRYDGAGGERRVWFNLRSEAEAAAVALNASTLPEQAKDVLAEKYRDEATVAAVVHGTVAKLPVVLFINSCPKNGKGATTRVIRELTARGLESGVALKWEDVRDVCNCPPGYCLAISSQNGDDMEAVSRKLDAILAENPAVPVVVTNRGVPHVLKNRHLAELSARPYWALAYQPSKFNQGAIGNAMVAFLDRLGVHVTVEELHAWSSEASEQQLAKRFKAASLQ